MSFKKKNYFTDPKLLNRSIQYVPTSLALYAFMCSSCVVMHVMCRLKQIFIVVSRNKKCYIREGSISSAVLNKPPLVCLYQLTCVIMSLETDSGHH